MAWPKGVKPRKSKLNSATTYFTSSYGNARRLPSRIFSAKHTTDLREQPLKCSATQKSAMSISRGKSGAERPSTPTNAADEMMLGLRRAAHEPDAGAFHRSPQMPCGWRRRADLTGCQMRAHSTTCRKRPGSPLPRGPSEEEFESQAGSPAGPPNAMRFALPRPAHGEPEGGALHNVCEAAGGLRRLGPPREER
jgi:hypothetical protein